MPTLSVIAIFSAPAGAFRLVYSAAIGNSEALNLDGAPVPVRATRGWQMLAVASLGRFRRRRHRQTSSPQNMKGATCAAPYHFETPEISARISGSGGRDRTYDPLINSLALQGSVAQIA